ncbi:uncharacterized protein FIESC28_09778 [Fusarium coffeatum]|uniref:Uncharacterized protein n=1 Tax=Fusarium coffeatum TaxID=231269 RepID=A0A366QZE7_9HYPO|nr:uncharacterized protein FIESC28_09778 [Fusarium coffeatum]RBR09608.1 hypothetical protein FIESC28_09778 [Fusarium coffeatum]
MKKAFDESEKAMLAKKQFNHQILRNIRKFTVKDFEKYSMYLYFYDFVALIPGADSPCAADNLEKVKVFARAQSSVYNLLPDITKDVNGTITESGGAINEKDWPAPAVQVV